MKYLSVCSGIEAATVAWHSLGWTPVAFSEIEAFPSAVLKHHYPTVPNLGDITQFKKWPIDFADVDLLAGGTPCQAFSVAGLRKSLSDARGNLSLIYIQLLDAIDEARNNAGRPAAICVWENVPGVLNTPDNAFGCFLGGLAGSGGALQPPGESGWTDVGYVRGPRRAIAWRCLDAQYLGLAQRRHRVFVVASARDGFDPAAVLFESQGVRRDYPPSREARERITGTISARTEGGGGLGTDFDLGGGLSRTLRAQPQSSHRADTETYVTETNHIPLASGGGMEMRTEEELCGTLIKNQTHAVAFAQNTRDEVRQINGDGAIAGALGSEPGMKQQTYVAIGIDGGEVGYALRATASHSGDKGDGGVNTTLVAHSLRAEGHDASEDGTGRGVPLWPVDVAPTLNAHFGDKQGLEDQHALNGAGHFVPGPQMAVRRLTPRECERLQGFPDDYTLIPYRGKPADQCPDGPRYKALGNSMAVPVMRWIGQSITQIDHL
jgi:DNA (cytosine-5)-methyltransferase 1